MRLFNLKLNSQFIILAFAIILGASIIMSATLASAQVENATIQFKKNPSTGLFTISFKDPQGLKEISIKPAGDKLPYGGLLSGCPRSHLIDNTVFDDPTDFTPVLKVTIVDCAGATSEFEVTPPVGGLAVGVLKSKIEEQKRLEEKVKQEEAEPAVVEEEGEEEEIDSKDEDSDESIIEAKANIKYPVAELGGCKSEASCRVYCDDADHIKSCLAYAEKNGLLEDEDLSKAKRFYEDAGGRGPGGCRGEVACRAYCENSERLEECLEFAEEHDFLPAAEIEEAKKILPLLKSGRTPGGCKSREQCEAYCEKPENMESCLAFAETNGLIPAEELAMAKKMLPLMKSGKTPGNCKNKAQCENHCQNPDNMRQCLAFAEEQGMMPAEELAMAKKMLPLMERGETPGGCRGKEQCEAYCGDEGHFSECVEFGVKAGFIKPEEAEAIKKAGGKGPGGCKSKESCETYCNAEDHMDECIEFAESAGLIKPEERGMIKFAKKLGCKSREECEAICADPVRGKQCQELFGGDGARQSPGMGPGGPGGGGFKGPGGCSSEEECMDFCSKNPKECEDFMSSQGGFPGGPPGGGGPRGGGGFPGGESGGFPGGADDAARRQFDEEVRREHIENVKSDSPTILNCLKNRVGEEVFARRQTGQIIDEAEGRLVKETLLACGAQIGPDRAPTPEDIERIKSQMAPGDSGAAPGNYPDQYQQQYQDQYRQQYEDQYREQYEQQYQQMQQMQQQYQQPYPGQM